MNSGTTSIKLNDMLTEFVDYVYSFYGDKKEALYPLFNVDTDKQVDKVDILGAVYDYLHEITRRNDDHFTWGDGDSLDRERVRDILIIKYGYDKNFTAVQYYGRISQMQTKSNKVRHIITLTTGQYDHLYNIMCSQDEIVDYLNESDWFDTQTFDNLFDNICAAKETYLP